MDVPMLPLDESVYGTLKNLIEHAGMTADVASPASPPVSMAESRHSAEPGGEPG